MLFANADAWCIRLRDTIWTLESHKPRDVPLNYCRDKKGIFRKVRPNINKNYQPPVLQVCKESRIVGQRHYELLRERGPQCRAECPRCRYEASDYGNMRGYKKESEHTRLLSEERNGHWVNFEVDIFCMSYRTNDGRCEGRFAVVSLDFAFELCDLGRIQRSSYSTEAEWLCQHSINWCFAKSTILKALKEF